MSAGWVHSWDLSTGVDGPGTRLVVFLAGCPMRCLYCQNPDTWFKRAGEEMQAEDVMRLMRRYAGFIERAGGGLTLSGGEPLQQPRFSTELLAAARELGLHSALDTSGFLGRRASDALLDATDLVLLDIKAGSDAAHRRLTRRPLAPTLEFAERLGQRAQPVWLRYVLVPGYNDAPSEVEAVAAFAARLGNVERVDVLPFHKLAAEKYHRLGIPFALEDAETASAALTSRVRDEFAAHALSVR
jgi:pyruvate formate lyase activating enzyme